MLQKRRGVNDLAHGAVQRHGIMGVRVRLARDVAARVGLGNQALFYYAYRDSAHIYEVIENDTVSSVDYFKGFFASRGEPTAARGFV